MKGYLAICKIRMKALLQYRAAAFAGICTQLFWGIVTTMILAAFYKGVVGSEPLTLSQAFTFIWIGQAFVRVLPWDIDKEIESLIKTGDVAYELVRPLHLYGVWYARSFAMRFVPAIMRSLPIFILSGCFFGLTAPVSWAAIGVFALSMIFALLLSSAITTVIAISLFWTVSGDGIQRLLPHVVVLFSGMVVPLPLFPSWMQPFLNYQPFRGIMDIPCRLYTGIIPTSDAVYYLLFQVAWIVGIVVFGQWLIGRAMKRLVIQGG